MKAIITRMITGKTTLRRDSLRLSQSTVLPIAENKIKETRMGQKDVWTAKKGLRNILESSNIRKICSHRHKL